jgi:alkylation response protein AidB-like acyl-CoA dehydrogenase
MPIQGPYRNDLRDIRFLFWNHFRIQDTLLAQPDCGFTTEDVDEILLRASDFALQKLGLHYQTADREGCRLENGEVVVPRAYSTLWREMHEAGWPLLSAPREYGGVESPFVLGQAINEMFLGANPCFMIYMGFGVSVLRLIMLFGDERVRSLFAARLAHFEWTACFCVTEPDAGSDIGLIRTRARPQPAGTYLLEGTKIFVSAGMHSLAPNIVYLVVARVEGAPAGTPGLSCFLVPRFRVDANAGVGADNNVRCTRVEHKMGLHGAATTELVFGASGPCEGYLLGTERRGLSQMLPLMNAARIATATFALGMASSAYLNAAAYASQRFQGTNLRETFKPTARRVPIIEHWDVRRMLLEMKAKVEGCRALLTKLSVHYSLAISKSSSDADVKRHQSLVNLLTPIAKAYVSDQAWRVAELAIQVYGGHGYISDHPVEQYARDIKIMSIWEGTNYVQSADLVRDQLAMGRTSRNMELFCAEVSESLLANASGEFGREAAVLTAALEAVNATHARFGNWLRDGRMETIFAFSTRFLEMMAEVAIGALLLEAAAAARLAQKSSSSRFDGDFLEGKVLAAMFYVRNVVPHVLTRHDVIAAADESIACARAGVFVSSAGH